MAEHEDPAMPGVYPRGDWEEWAARNKVSAAAQINVLHEAVACLAEERDEAVAALKDICMIGVGTTSARADALEMQRLARAALDDEGQDS